MSDAKGCLEFSLEKTGPVKIGDFDRNVSFIQLNKKLHTGCGHCFLHLTFNIIVENCLKNAISKMISPLLLLFQDVFIFDTKQELFVWVGSQTTHQERKNAMTYAHVRISGSRVTQIVLITKSIRSTETKCRVDTLYIRTPLCFDVTLTLFYTYA